MSDLTRAMLDDFLPDGPVWEPEELAEFDLLLEGIADNLEIVRVFLSTLSEIRNPNLTIILSDLEREYGIPTNTLLSESTRRTRLAELVFGTDGNGTEDDLETALRNVGFDVFVYQNSIAVDPAGFISASDLLVGGLATFDFTNIILNGTFETGDFTAWTANGSTIDNTNPATGIFCSKLIATDDPIDGAESDKYAVDSGGTFILNIKNDVSVLTSGIYKVIINYYDAGDVFISSDVVVSEAAATDGYVTVEKRIGPANISPDFVFPSDTAKITVQHNWDLGTPLWDTSTAVYDTLFKSVAAEDNDPTGIFFSPDGLRMFMVGRENISVYSYTLGTAWDVSTAVYDTISFGVVDQSGTPSFVFFSPDGVRMFIMGAGTDTIHSYTLGTPWDISTAVYDNLSKRVTTEDATPQGFFFSQDGLRMFMVGTQTDTVYSYTLSTAWNVSTAVYDGVFKFIGSEDTFPRDVFFSPDGLHMFIVGDTNNSVFSYTLGTAWDLSTAVYDGTPFSVAGEDTAPFSLFLSPDGLRMFMMGRASDTVYSYTFNFAVGTAFMDDVEVYQWLLNVKQDYIIPTDQDDWPLVFFVGGAATFDTVNLIINGGFETGTFANWTAGSSTIDAVNPRTGTSCSKLVTTGSDLDGAESDMYQVKIYKKYFVSVWNDITAYVAGTYKVIINYYDEDDVFISSDDVVSETAVTVGYEQTVKSVGPVTAGVPYNLNTISYDSLSFNVTAEDFNPVDVFFSPDGFRMFILGSVTNSVYSYTLGTAWNVSTAVYDNLSFSVATEDTSLLCVFFSQDGLRMFIIGNITNSVHSYTLGTAWDVSTAVYDNVPFSVNGQDIAPTYIFFSPDGTRMFMVGQDTDSVYSYTLGTAWDLSTAVYDNLFFSVAGQDTNPSGVFFSQDGLRMLLLGFANKSVFSYTLGTALDVSTAVYDGVPFSVNSEDITPIGIFFRDDGLRMFIMGNANTRVFSYTITPDFIFPDNTAKITVQHLMDGTPTITAFMDDVEVFQDGTGLTAIATASVPVEREDEFKGIILRYKPLHAWAALVVSFP